MIVSEGVLGVPPSVSVSKFEKLNDQIWKCPNVKTFFDCGQHANIKHNRPITVFLECQMRTKFSILHCTGEVHVLSNDQATVITVYDLATEPQTCHSIRARLSVRDTLDLPCKDERINLPPSYSAGRWRVRVEPTHTIHRGSREWTLKSCGWVSITCLSAYLRSPKQPNLYHHITK